MSIKHITALLFSILMVINPATASGLSRAPVASGAHAQTTVLLRDDANHVCSGTLVSPRWVLTAQHCLTDMPRGTVYFGVNADELAIRYQRTFLAPSGEDIALLALDYPATGRPYTPLHDGYTVEAMGEVYGWGGIQNGMKSLTYAPVKVSGTLTDFGSTFYRVFTQNGGLIIGGDSGGPLIVDGKVTGVMSRFYNANHTWGLYTNVYHHLGWIRSVMNQNMSDISSTPPDGIGTINAGGGGSLAFS